MDVQLKGNGEDDSLDDEDDEGKRNESRKGNGEETEVLERNLHKRSNRGRKLLFKNFPPPAYSSSFLIGSIRKLEEYTFCIFLLQPCHWHWKRPSLRRQGQEKVSIISSFQFQFQFNILFFTVPVITIFTKFDDLMTQASGVDIGH